MASLLETPSRIWRRIEAEGSRDMPSLPSVPGFDDSAEISNYTENPEQNHDTRDERSFGQPDSPIHSTPAASTIRPSSSTNSTTRFANSLARSARSSLVYSSVSRAQSTRPSYSDSFDISAIPPLPEDNFEDESDYQPTSDDLLGSKESAPEEFGCRTEGEEERDLDISLPDALESISSPYNSEPERGRSTKEPSYIDYEVPLKSSAPSTPFSTKFRHVAMRRPLLERTRTPSLSRTTPSPASSPVNSTPRSGRSVGLDSSASLSPIQGASVPLPASNAESVEQHEQNSLSDTHSMDITDIHISPIRQLDSGSEAEEGTVEESISLQEEGPSEHTFSTDDGLTPYINKITGTGEGEGLRSQEGLASAFSSPAQSMTTPTPPFLALSNWPDGEEESLDEPLTPHTRRRSFLLSVINSTTRPRMKFPTSHPRSRIPPDTPSVMDATPLPAGDTLGFRAAFAGATPRPRFRASDRIGEVADTTARPDNNNNEHLPWSTPAPVRSVATLSPYEEALVNGASFISTASSHDLTTHPRANTSFDPAMGFVGRFNAGKLNTYLHGLNRRLQEENETLIERLRRLEESQGKSGSTSIPPTPATSSSRRQSGGSRRQSTISNLGDLQEEVGETWLEEKAELEEMVETFKNEVEQCMREKEEVEKILEQEALERQRDKERWKERMSEVQRGVTDIVRDLEAKWHSAEEEAKNAMTLGSDRVNEMEKKLTEAEAQRDDAATRAAKAESALANNQDLGIKALEQEVIRSEEFIDGLEHDFAKQTNTIADLQKVVQSRDEQIKAQQTEFSRLEKAHQGTQEMLNATREFVGKIEEDAAAAVSRSESLEDELANAKADVAHLRNLDADRETKGEQLVKETERAAELARQLEEALEAAEKKMAEDEDELAALKGKLTALERDKERQKELSSRSIEHSRLPFNSAAQTAAHEAEIEALEHELDDATKEIARLNTLLNQSPARKAVDKAKDTKIEMLEQENEALSERIKALRMTMKEYNTPSKIANYSGISPMHRRALSMSLRGPKTPMSWLNNTVDPSFTPPLVAEIARLQQELDSANESIDDKLDKLEDAGLGVVGLTKKLEDARSTIRQRRLCRLERARCQKCLTKINVRSLMHLAEDESSMFEAAHDTLPTEPPTPPTKTSEALRTNLRTVNSQLQETRKQWEDEKRKLLGEKAALQNAANRLNAQVRDAKEEATKASEAQKASGRQRQDIQGDLDMARLTIAELESDLKAERARLRAMSTEQNRVSKEKERIYVQLQRTETDIEDVRNQLQTCKKENRELEKELRVRVAENLQTMEQLREERALLAADHKDLQQRYSEVSEHANKLLDTEAASRTTHDKHRHQLDLYLGEIEDLRKALSDRSEELHIVEAEKLRVAAERSDVAQTVAALEADLKRVRQNAEAFGRDLKNLRAEKERLERKHQEEQSRADRTKKQTQTQIRLLTEQLEGQRAKTLKAREDLENHVCALDDRQLSALRIQHNKESKGLIVQIRYLKAKFTRESMLRFDLAYQKHYLLVLLNKFEKSEQTISAAIARIGFPIVPPPHSKRRKFKNIVRSIIFVTRVKRASEEWRKQSAPKKAVEAALDDVHQRRTAVSTKS
ncbi:hypothetical protein BDP27DRAFT_1319010 [Rhodocollybia butyracea]|uniref:Pericentrin/AKAP-450 centrosomal targeting domain-containing protein n=1 Tax=Rhodocollybia butyracea TaxID=206335 RepID=A0A9P5Q1L6_9AGAR|nr:hypothetical protein BDP27DRAFT_1319010 [Rhodocollybia butyracea]